MLKVLPKNLFTSSGSAKCGEIYCHSPTEFTIQCTFCELKSFEYDDFLLHFKNMHFENNLLKTEELSVEISPYPHTHIKKEINQAEETEGEFPTEDVYEEGALSSDDDDDDSAERLMKWKQPHVRPSQPEAHPKSANSSSEEDNDADEEYKPPAKTKQPKAKSKQLSTKEKEYKCQHCDKVYQNAGNLTSHMKKNHTPAEIVMVKCPDCSEEYSNQRLLDDHCNVFHEGIPCTFCGKRFKYRPYYTSHLETHMHNRERKFPCDFEDCNKRFYTRRLMLNHRRNHTGPKNFICDVCGYSCRVPETLKVHYRTHTGEKPYKCDVCGKCFASSSLRMEHKQSHMMGRPHVCDICGATFARQKGLYHHKFLHLGIKKFKCRLCDNAYAQASGLAGHMRKHKEEGMC